MSVSKRAAKKFGKKRFNCKKRNNVEVSNIRLNSEIGLQFGKTWIMMWTSIRTGNVSRENIKAPPQKSLSCYELKQHKPWFDEMFKSVRSKEGC
jgi:hypothetical protein